MSKFPELSEITFVLPTLMMQITILYVSKRSSIGNIKMRRKTFFPLSIWDILDYKKKLYTFSKIIIVPILTCSFPSNNTEIIFFSAMSHQHMTQDFFTSINNVCFFFFVNLNTVPYVRLQNNNLADAEIYQEVLISFSLQVCNICPLLKILSK